LSLLSPPPCHALVAHILPYQNGKASLLSSLPPGCGPWLRLASRSAQQNLCRHHSHQMHLSNGKPQTQYPLARLLIRNATVLLSRPIHRHWWHAGDLRNALILLITPIEFCNRRHHPLIVRGKLNCALFMAEMPIGLTTQFTTLAGQIFLSIFFCTASVPFDVAEFRSWRHNND
jgi:hypothetical protein